MYCAQRKNLDVTETDTGYEWTVPVPGANTEKLVIDVHEDVLTVAAKPDLDTGGRKRVSREQFPAKYEHRLRLGRDIDSDNIQATLKNGILTVSLPKKGKSEPRKIDIQ